jgi:membrane protease subunit (stomatin/prohibitin family)
MNPGVPQAPNAPPQAPQAPPTGAAGADLKFCLHCGKQISRAANFCPECGGKQE